MKKQTKLSLILTYVAVLCVGFVSCSKEDMNGQEEDGNTENSEGSIEDLSPGFLKSGDRLYELYPDGKIKNYYDILSNGKIKYGGATATSGYVYEKLTSNTSLFSCTIQQTTDLYDESYIRWW